jgi:hypothetical protein
VFTAEKQTISMNAGETREVQKGESETETERPLTPIVRRRRVAVEDVYIVPLLALLLLKS